MKNIALTLILLFNTIALTAQTADETAIKNVIGAETKAFFDLDYPKWTSLWLQSPHDCQAWNNSDGGIFYTVGWDKVSAGAKDYIEKATKMANPPTITRENWDFQIAGDMAALSFDQHYAGENGTTMSKEFRTMVRQNGQWKISKVQSFWDYKNAKK